MHDLLDVVSWLGDHARMFSVRDYFDIALISLAGVVIINGLVARLGKKRGKSMPMTKKEREKYRNDCAIDILTDGLELYVAEGLLTRWDAGEIYKNLGKRMGWLDLLPRRRKTTMSQKVKDVLHGTSRWAYTKPKITKEVTKRKRSADFKVAT